MIDGIDGIGSRSPERLLDARVTRRGLLRSVGVGGAAAWLLAACGRGSEPDASPTGSPDPGDLFDGPAAGSVRVGNWPLYIDKAKDEDGQRYSPSLREFTERTGIEVEYREIIQDYPSFLGKVLPQFEAGEPIGWDVIVIGGRELTVLQQRGWLTPLDPSKRPNFEESAATWAKDPSFDVGNVHTMAWQGGLTAIGVNRELVSAPIARLDDLADPSKVGTNSVGMITSEMGDFVMMNLGIDPVTSGPEEWREAADWLLMQRESGTVRAYYDQGYVDDLTGGNLAASMAWSGDVLYYSVWAGLSELEFVLPEGGGLRWIDSMAIPVNAEHPVDALAFMDFYYDPDIAVMVTEWALTMPPVEGVQEIVRQHADEALDEGAKIYGNKLLQTAESRFTFPDEEVLAATSFVRDLPTDEEREEWDSIFLPISQG